MSLSLRVTDKGQLKSSPNNHYLAAQPASPFGQPASQQGADNNAAAAAAASSALQGVRSRPLPDRNESSGSIGAHPHLCTLSAICGPSLSWSWHRIRCRALRLA